MSNLNEPWFNNPEAAREHLEAIRWPNGPVCPHCGSLNVRKVTGTKHRPGLYACREKECGGHFTATVGTLFERSHVPLHMWFQAVYFLCSSKKGMSAHQLHRTLGVTYKTAWFMFHRIREGMKEGAWPGQLGGSGKIVEADETFIGRKEGRKVKRGSGHKMAAVSLVERGGKVRSFHVENVNALTLRKVLTEQVDPASRLMTDESTYYKRTGKQFAEHHSVNHSADEYVRGDAHTNTLEGFFSVFKRGMKGVYQHCSERHLKRYLTEFDFRYNNRSALGINDWQRTIAALRGIEGRRLTYGGSRRPQT
jgi:transposase-like protein